MSNRIRFGEPIESELPEENLPPNFLLSSGTGRWQEPSFQVYMVQDVYADVWRHISETPNIESGGILVGHPFKTGDGQTTFVVITAAIPQHSRNRSAGHFTVGPAEIAAARARMEQEHPGLIPVGWYHSHPGHGVFLSGQDMTIVRSIYNASWQIAMVIDPLRRMEGIFVGPEGERIGGQGNEQPPSSWIGLEDEPDSVKAIALYNRAKEALDEYRPQDAHNVLDKLQALVQDSEQLKHWRKGYRDVAELQTRVEEQLTSKQEPVSLHPIPPRPAPPHPARASRSSLPEWRGLLGFSAVAAISLVLFFSTVAVFQPQSADHPLTLGFGILLSLLAVVIALYVVFADGIGSDQSSPVRQREWLTNSTIKRFGALASTALVILSWCGLLFLNLYSMGPAVGPAPPINPSPLPVLSSPTATVTLTLPDTPVLLPTPTVIFVLPTDTPALTPTSVDSDLPSPPTLALTVTVTPLENNNLLTQTETITNALPTTDTLESP